MPPTASFSAVPGSVNAGESVFVIFSDAADASPADTGAGFLYSYDCEGDDIFEVVDITTDQFTCTYASAGVYTATGQVKDKDGGYSEYSANVTVNAVDSNGNPHRLNRVG